MLSSEEKEKIVRTYLSGNKCRSVASQCGVSYQTVYNVLHNLAVPMRNDLRLPIHNEGAFSKLTPESAYWVGFLLSDGCIHWLRGKYARLVVELQIGDWNHLEKLREFLGAEIEVKPSHKGKAARLDISSERIARDLGRLWVTPRKSCTATVTPLLIENKDFWRGMIDGDGNLGFHKNNGCPHLGLIGTASVIQSFKHFCKGNGTIGKHKHLKTLVLYSYNAAALAKQLYDKAKVYLDRKKTVADKVMKYEHRCDECHKIIEGRKWADLCTLCLPVVTRKKARNYKNRRIKEEKKKGRHPCHNCIKRDAVLGKRLCFKCREY